MIRRLLLAALLFAVGAVCARQQELPWLSPRKDASGREGYFDREGNNVIPCVFEYAAHFPEGYPVAYVRHEGRCYLIDRTGGRITEESFENAPLVWPHFFLTRHYGSAPDRLVGFDGAPISPERGHVVPVHLTTDRSEPLFFALREEGKSTFRLVDLSFRPIAPIHAAEFERTVYAPELIRFRTDSGYGLLNAEGKVILPAQYGSLDDRDIDALYALKQKLRKAGCWSDELGAVVLFIARRGTTLALFDETGRQVVPPQQAKNVSQLIDKAFKTHLLPYARRTAETRLRIEQTVKAPFAARQAAHGRLAAALPAPRRNGSMVDFVRRAEAHPGAGSRTPDERLRSGREHAAAERYDPAPPSAGGTNRTAAAGKTAAESRSAGGAAASDRGTPRATPPTGGTIYLKHHRKMACCSIEFDVSGDDPIIRPDPPVPLYRPGTIGAVALMLVETTDDAFVYRQYKVTGGTTFQNMRPVTHYRNEAIPDGATITLTKDLSEVRYSNGLVCDTRIDRKEFDRMKQAIRDFIRRAEAYGGGDGESGAVEVEPGMNASYYRSMYDRWARVAESAYRSLTATGISVRDREGGRAGSAAGSWQGSRYAGMKSELTKAQSAMRRIRSEAARAGHSIGQSPWETATVSY